MAQAAIPLERRPRKPLHARRGGFHPSPLAALALLALVALGAYMVYSRLFTASGTPAAAPTYVAATETAIASTVSTTGTVAATQQVTLTFDIGTGTGKISQVFAKLGDRVSEGQALAKLDDTDLQQALKSANSSLASAQARLAAITKPSAADLTSSRQSVLSAEQQVQNAQKTLDDLRAGPKAADILSAKQNVTSAEGSLTAARNNLTKGQAQITTDQSAVQEAKAELQAAQTTMQGAYRDVLTAYRSATQSTTSSSSSTTSSTATTLPATCPSPPSEGSVAPYVPSTCTSSYATAMNNYSSARTKYLTAKKAVTTAEQTLTDDQNNLSNLRNAVESAELSLKTAKQKYADTMAPATTAEIQAAEKSLEVANASLSSAKERNGELLDPPVDEVLPLQAAVDQAQASVATAQKNLDAATITAPFAGQISQVSGEVGTQVNANTGVFILLNPNLVRIDANVDQAYISKLKVGQTATVTFDALTGSTYKAAVAAIGLTPTTSQGVVTYIVTFSVDTAALAEGTPVPTPGMTASITVTTNRADKAIVVPARAVRNQTVTVKTATGTEERTVTTGITNGTFTQITSGLMVGEEVLVTSTSTTTTSTSNRSTTTQQPTGPGGGPPPGGFP